VKREDEYEKKIQGKLQQNVKKKGGYEVIKKGGKAGGKSKRPPGNARNVRRGLRQKVLTGKENNNRRPLKEKVESIWNQEKEKHS